jgi:hypothetical protein
MLLIHQDTLKNTKIGANKVLIKSRILHTWWLISSAEEKVGCSALCRDWDRYKVSMI